MNQVTAFPKIFAIGTDYIKDIFQEDVEITEKVDGSQFVFGKIDGELSMRSKGCIQYAEKHDKMFDKACDYVMSIEDKLPDNTIFYCEYLQKPKHNTLAYDTTPKNNLVLFGACTTAIKFVSEHVVLTAFAESLDIDVIPLLYKGRVSNLEELTLFLERDSYLGGCKIEGMVVKNYLQPFLLGGQPIPVMAGKYVSEAFKEVHRKNWTKDNTCKGKFETMKRQYCTEARWEKAIQHLKEQGELENAPRDIGKLLKEVNSDIVAEEKENIKNELWKLFSREILAGATRGFPEFYKKKLMGNSDFGGK